MSRLVPAVMAPHGTDPVFFGTRSGNNDMKSATTVHFIGGRGATFWGGLEHRHCHSLPVGGETTDNDREG